MNTRVFFLFLFIVLCASAYADQVEIEVFGPAQLASGVLIRAGDDKVIVNFDGSEMHDAMAEKIVEEVNKKSPPFFAFRVGNIVFVSHAENDITVRKVRVENTEKNTASYNNGTPQFASENMIAFSGTAIGDGIISINNGDFNVSVQTTPGQSAMEVVEALRAAMQESITDDGRYAFWMEWTDVSLEGPPNPVSTVDLAIAALGSRNLLLTSVTSTDQGISVQREARTTNYYIPTLSQWAVIILMLLTLTIGTLFILRKKPLPVLVTTLKHDIL